MKQSLRISVAALQVFLASSLFAQAHREHGAHEHGIATLDITVDGKSIDLDFESPAVNIIGFEHEARTPSDRAKQAKALDTIRNHLAQIFQFDPGAGCKIAIKSLKVEKEENEGSGEHRSVAGEFSVTCAKPPAGTQLKLGFTRFFGASGLTKIRVQVMSDKPVSTVIENDRGSVPL